MINKEYFISSEAETKLGGLQELTSVRPVGELLHELQVQQIELEMQNENLRQSQIALEESRDRYQDLYDFAPVAYLTLDELGMIVEINLTGAELLGMERKRLIRRRFDQFVASAENACWQLYFLNLFNSAYCCELRLKRQDGTQFYARLDSRCINADAKTARIMLTDITERKVIEQALRESEEKLSAIFEGALDGIVLIDDTGMIVDCNPEFRHQSGMTSDQLKQTRIWELRPADKAELTKKIFFEIMNAGSGGAAEFKFKQPDGNVIHIAVRGVILSIGGKCYLQCITHDISVNKSIELELREYQQLLRELAAQGAASREAELKHIAREVHDELGQILTALRMDISLIRIQFGVHDSNLMPKIQDMLILVDKAIQGARDVTANLHPPALDMGVVPAIAWLSNEFTARTSIPCGLRVLEEPTCLDDARTLTLFRIVQESLTNITRYAQATRVEITIGKCVEAITIEILDDGTGFDNESLPTAKSFGLMGMKERALAVGGKVEITSAPGLGTVVFVEIPLLQVNPGRRIND